MKSIDKFVLVLVASLALLLAGCGGGSPTTTPPEETSPTAEEMAAAAIMEAKDALTAAQGQLSGATTDTEMLAAYQAIHMEAENLITVLGANGGSTEDVVAATVARENAADMVASLEKKIADAAEAAAAAALAAMIKEVGTKNAAMDAEKAQAIDGGLGGTTASALAADAEGSYALSISRNRMGTTVEVTVNGATDDDDVKFTSSDVSDGLTKHVRTHEADDDGNVMEETAMVMTNIEAPTATAFGMVHTLDVSTNTDNDSPSETNEALSALAVANVMASDFTSATQAVLTFPFDDAGTANTDEAAEVEGTYDGASGTYRCNGTAVCTVSINAMGGITAMGNGWIFTPDMGATVDVADAEYHHYGFWIKKTTDSDGVVTYNEVETFFGTSTALVASTGTITGTASYSGGALGVYTHKVLDAEGESTAVSGGHFTADASLSATFGQVTNDADQGTIAESMLNTVTGTIDNFMLAGGESNSWAVELEGNINSTAFTVTETDWSAAFYGATDETPSAVLGEFNAAFANGQVAGAFGADLQDE